VEYADPNKRSFSRRGLVRAAACIILSYGWLPAVQDQSQEVANHFRAAQQAAKAGELEHAAKEYQTVLSLDPMLVEAMVNLGLTYHALGSYQQAAGQLERALRAQPDLFPANLFLGIEYAKLGYTAKALPPLERAVRSQPASVEARRALAGCLLSKDEYRGAAEQFRSLFTLQPNQEEAWYALGRDYLEMVMDLVNRLITRHGEAAWTKRLAGDLQAEGGGMSLNDAAVSYKQALALDPDQPGLHARLGGIYLRQAKIDEAKQEFRRELQRDADNEDGLLGMAEADLATGDAAGALQQISSIWAVFPPFLGQQSAFPSIDLLPELAAALITDLGRQAEGPARSFLRSCLYRLADEPQKAEEQGRAFQAYLNEWSSSPPARATSGVAGEACAAHRYRRCVEGLQAKHNLTAAQEVALGRAQLRLGQDDQASDAFAAALSKDPQNLESIYWLVRTYTRQATACFTQLAGLFPDSWRAHELHGEEYRVEIQYERAIKEYQIAATMRPDSPELHEKLCELYLDLHQKPMPEAKAEIERTLELDPSRARALYLLGRIYVMRREYPTAIPLLEKALRFEPNLMEAHAELGKALLHSGQVQPAVRELEEAASIDYYGDVHYQLYDAYHQLGKTDLAQKALARSQELRKQSVANQMAKVASAEPE